MLPNSNPSPSPTPNPNPDQARAVLRRFPKMEAALRVRAEACAALAALAAPSALPALPAWPGTPAWLLSTLGDGEEGSCMAGDEASPQELSVEALAAALGVLLVAALVAGAMLAVWKGWLRGWRVRCVSGELV